MPWSRRWGKVHAVVCSVAGKGARETSTSKSHHAKSDDHGLGESSAGYFPGDLGSSVIFTRHAILLIHQARS
jgi:hypothetical protein